MIDSGRDPREGIFSIFGVDCSLVVGLCFYNHYIYTYIYIYNLYYFLLTTPTQNKPADRDK